MIHFGIIDRLSVKKCFFLILNLRVGYEQVKKMASFGRNLPSEVNPLIRNQSKSIDKKKEIQIKRMMQYFIDATVEIIEEEDIDKITIRKIADKAGYNSATIYNYFQEVSHLIFFAAMTFLRKYIEALPSYIAKGTNSLEKLLLIWQCFCEFSFKEPKIYYAIFASDLGQVPADLVEKYYTIFPDDLQNLPDDLLPMVLETNLTKRGRIALQKCVEDGYIKEETAEEINEMCTLIWHGMLSSIINNRRNCTAEEAVEITMKYIRQILYNATHFNFQSDSTWTPRVPIQTPVHVSIML